MAVSLGTYTFDAEFHSDHVIPSADPQTLHETAFVDSQYLILSYPYTFTGSEIWTHSPGTVFIVAPPVYALVVL